MSTGEVAAGRSRSQGEGEGPGVGLGFGVGLGSASGSVPAPGSVSALEAAVGVRAAKRPICYIRLVSVSIFLMSPAAQRHAERQFQWLRCGKLEPLEKRLGRGQPALQYTPLARRQNLSCREPKAGSRPPGPFRPRTFFWPLGGLRFRRQRRLERWGWRMLGRYYPDPEVMWSEGLAALVLLAFGSHLKRQRRLGRFLRSGRP